MNLGCLVIGWILRGEFSYGLFASTILCFVGGIISMKCYGNEAIKESKMLLENIKAIH